MKISRHSEILDRGLTLLVRLKSAQFRGLPLDTQLDWLKKIWLEFFAELMKANCSHGRVVLHSVLGFVLATAEEIGIRETLISQLKPKKKAKHSIDCHKTLKVYLYLISLADKLQTTEEDFLKDYKKIQLGALYVLSSAPESEALTNEVLDYLRRDFWLSKSTAEALIENYVPKTSLIGSNFWVKKSRSGRKWVIPCKTLGEKIRYLRSECNISQSQLGEKLGLSTISVFHLEKGDRKLDAVELWLIAKEFADKSREFKALSECLDKILGGRSEKIYLDDSKLSRGQTSAIGSYFSGNDSDLKLRSAVREAIGLISIKTFHPICPATSRIKANFKCGIAPYKRLGEKIKLLRLQNGISRVRLSNQIGMAAVSVFHLERGDRRIDIKELRAISKALAGSSSEFLVLSKWLERILD